MQNLIIIRGYPGSGKTTLSKKLSEASGFVMVDHNHILNLIRALNGGDDEGIYDEIHSLELGIARSWLKKGQSAVVARGFTTAKSLSPYLEMAKTEGAQSLVFRLDVPQDVLAVRVTSSERTENGFATTAEYLDKWVSSHPMEDFESEFVLDGKLAPEVLVTQIQERL